MENSESVLVWVQPSSREHGGALFYRKPFFGPWVIVKKIDEGGFGQVYKVENANTKKVAALKAESNEIEGGSALKLEMTVIRTITADGDKPHIPLVFHAAKHKRFCYMIMTLLGENLKELKDARSPRDVEPPYKAVFSVKLVHDYGFVHRDIKPNNFVMGYRDDYDRARLVHILDFGLSRSYAIQNKDGKWNARRARGTAEFRGTLRYCSPNVHEKKEQGRRDDLWSLYYVLIELHCGLPWQTLRDKQKVELMKMHMSDKDLVLNFPVELHGIIPHLRTLDYYQRPDYSMFYNGLVAVMKRVGAKTSDPFDWETPESVRRIERHHKAPYAWENSSDFFKSDPVKVNCAPPPKQPKKRKPYENKVFVVQNIAKEQSDQTTATTASTDVEKRSAPSELTMTDVDRRLLAFGVVRKSPETFVKIKEQLAKRKLECKSPAPCKETEAKATEQIKKVDKIEERKKKLTLVEEQVKEKKKKDKHVDTAEDFVKREKDKKKKSSMKSKEEVAKEPMKAKEQEGKPGMVLSKGIVEEEKRDKKAKEKQKPVELKVKEKKKKKKEDEKKEKAVEKQEKPKEEKKAKEAKKAALVKEKVVKEVKEVKEAEKVKEKKTELLFKEAVTQEEEKPRLEERIRGSVTEAAKKKEETKEEKKSMLLKEETPKKKEESVEKASSQENEERGVFSVQKSLLKEERSIEKPSSQENEDKGGPSMQEVPKKIEKSRENPEKSKEKPGSQEKQERKVPLKGKLCKEEAKKEKSKEKPNSQEKEEKKARSKEKLSKEISKERLSNEKVASNEKVKEEKKKSKEEEKKKTLASKEDMQKDEEKSRKERKKTTDSKEETPKAGDKAKETPAASKEKDKRSEENPVQEKKILSKERKSKETEEIPAQERKVKSKEGKSNEKENKKSKKEVNKKSKEKCRDSKEKLDTKKGKNHKGMWRILARNRKSKGSTSKSSTEEAKVSAIGLVDKAKAAARPDPGPT